MPIYAREPQSSFQPAPEGLHNAVCVDVIDLGLQDTPWGVKPKVELRWQIEEQDDRGKRFELRKRYQNSLHPKAKLRQDLEMWRGRKFADDELKRMDLERLLGAPCQLQVIHNVKDGGETYANVQAVIPMSKGATKLLPLDYVREQDRAKAAGLAHGDGPLGDVTEDDDVPF